MRKEVFEKIIKKKEFSELPKKDIELAFSKFEKRQVSEEEKVRLTRELLHKVFGAFLSRKVFSSKERDFEWYLKKHISTRERFEFYKEIYQRILKDKKEVSIIDLGAGVNGLSYFYFESKKLNYVAIEAVGQMVRVMNNFFKKNKLTGNAYHLSLFDLEEIRKLIKKQKGEKIVFLFKTLDSLEMVERDYSKKLLLELKSITDKIVISFATRSLISKKKFKAKRKWLIDFISENFKILDDFEFNSERYIVLNCN